MKTKLLSIGCNRKLGKKVAVFNLPQGKTCPGKTALCREICYAAKAERMYPAAAAMRARNLVAAEKDTFVDDMIAEILGSGVTKVRIHESGDLFSQEYLDKWIAIMEACSRVQFLAYTKSFHLDWTTALDTDNLSLLWSIDKTTKIRPPLPGPTAYTVAKGEDRPPVSGEVTCTHTSDKHYCGTECTLCWDDVGHHIYFPQH